MALFCAQCRLSRTRHGFSYGNGAARTYAAGKAAGRSQKQAPKGKTQGPKRMGPVSSSYSRKPSANVFEDRRGGGPAGGGGSKSGGLNIGPLNPTWFRSAPTLNSVKEFHPDDHLNWSSRGHPRLFSRSFEKAIGIFGVPDNVKAQFALTARPAAILRHSTMRLMDALDLASGREETTKPEGDAQGSAADAGTERTGEKKPFMTLTGSRGSGKSYTALQAMNYAISQDWLVYYNPDVTEWVNSSYAYRPASQQDSSGDSSIASAPYVQDSLALTILRKFYDFNSGMLDQVPVPIKMARDQTSSDNLGGYIKPWMTTNSIDMEKGAQAMLTWVLEVIRGQDQIPMLITLDGINSLFRDSLYNTEIGQPIPAPNLGVPRLFLEYMTGRKTMNAGMCLNVVSATLPPPFSNTPELLDSLYPNTSLSSRQGRFKHRDLYTGLSSLLRPNRLHLTSMNEDEARGLYGLLLDAGCTGAKSSEESFLKVWNESTGNPKLFTQAAFTQGLGL